MEVSFIVVTHPFDFPKILINFADFFLTIFSIWKFSTRYFTEKTKIFKEKISTLPKRLKSIHFIHFTNDLVQVQIIMAFIIKNLAFLKDDIWYLWMRWRCWPEGNRSSGYFSILPIKNSFLGKACYSNTVQLAAWAVFPVEKGEEEL